MVAPAEAVAVIVPLAAPLQDTLVALALMVTAMGCVMVTVVLAVHVPLLLPSGAVATMVYVPGPYVAAALYALPLTVMVAPAEAEAVIVPSAAPLQDTLVDVALTVTWIGSVIVTVVEAVHEPLLLPFGAVATMV
jgi:hypothetical protein